MSASNNTPKTIKIQLPRNLFCVIDEIDSDLVALHWGISQYGYARHQARKDGRVKEISMSRLILSRMIGRELLKSELCDHRDGNRLNNSRSNLRIATSAQNNANSRKQLDTKNRLKGAYLHGDHGKKWIAMISVNNRRVYLGRYLTEIEAHEAYCKAARLYFGEFAKCE